MPIQRWRCPIVVTAKSAVLATAGIVLAKVFFPLWFAVPVMAVLGVWTLSLCVRRVEVLVDADAGLIVFRMGLITRRVRLANLTAVQVDRGKVSIARSDGWEMSVYAWRKSRLDGWLRVPVVADDLAHAISRSAAAAREAQPADGAPSTRTFLRWSRRQAALAVLGCTGLVALSAAFLVRVTWPSPVMTAIGVVLALSLGAAGVLYVLVSFWLLLQHARQAPERT